jgi:hypothetical protein
MSERLTTLMHDTATRVHPRLQPPEALRREAERRQRAQRGAALIAVVAAVIVTVMAVTGLRTTHQTYPMPAQQPDWAPAQGNSSVGDWEITEGPTVGVSGRATSGCKPAGTGCPRVYIRVVAINRADVAQAASSLTATGRYTDGSGERWRVECRRAAPPRASRLVRPGQKTLLFCDNAGKPFASIDNVNATSIRLIEN